MSDKTEAKSWFTAIAKEKAAMRSDGKSKWMYFEDEKFEYYVTSWAGVNVGGHIYEKLRK